MASNAVSAAIAAASAKLELDSASAFHDTRWLNHSDTESNEGDLDDDDEEDLSGLSEVEREDDEVGTDGELKLGPRKAAATAISKITAASKKGKQQAEKVAPPIPQSRVVEEDELVLEPSDALKLKVVIEAIAPALLHFRMGSRQVPFRDVVPRDQALHSPDSIIGPPPPADADEVAASAYYNILKQSWPTPERIERLKTVAIVQLPRDLEAEADHADGTEQDTFATLSDALEAALGTAADGMKESDAHADESREEEDFVRLRNVIFLVSSIRRQFFRLLRNPSAPAGLLQPDHLGRSLPPLRHKSFRIVSQPAAPKPDEEEAATIAVGPNGTPTSPATAPVASTAPVPISLTRADTALTSLWTETWFTEMLRGSTLALALLNEVAEKKRCDESLVARIAQASASAAQNGDSAPSRKRARLDHHSSTSQVEKGRHPPKIALHMRLGVFGDFFTNAVDMPRKFWERQQRSAAMGQFAAEGENETTDDEEGSDGPGGRTRRRSGLGRRSAAAAVAASTVAPGTDAALQSGRRGKPKGSGKGMGKGWRKGRTKAMEEIEEVNREEERRRDRWAKGDIDFGPASIVTITPYRATKTASDRIPTLGERLRANGPVADLSSLAQSKPSASQDPLTSITSPSSIPLHKRFPGRLADFLYYNQYSSFAPAFDTSRSSASGEGTAALWWEGRQNENRKKRFHEESAMGEYALSSELTRAFGDQDADMLALEPPPLPVGMEEEIGEPVRLLDDEEVAGALARVGEWASPSGQSVALDPELLQKAYTELSGSQVDGHADGNQKMQEGEVEDDEAEDGDDVEAMEAVLRQNQYLLQALVVLQGQRLLTQVRHVDSKDQIGSSRDRAPEALPVERLIARELLSSLGTLVALRPRSDSTSLVPSTETLRAASASALLPTEEPAYWGTLTEAQYIQTLPLLLVDQIHREPARKGPLVLRDNMAALLADKAALGTLQHQQQQAGYPSGFPPSANVGPAGEAAHIYARRGHHEVSASPGGAYPVQQSPMVSGSASGVSVPTASGSANAMYGASPTPSYSNAGQAHASPAQIQTGRGVFVPARPAVGGALGISPYNQAAYASPQQQRQHLLQQQQQRQSYQGAIGTASPAQGQAAHLHQANHH
ncbi:hypothetical protein A4X13_0g5107 [Tilletia indica]|uniref:Uncharacterized protein n=1 Tax=Tilletia indica TaxID=43049 RepID=A0A177TH65_9BASI|nr:hypothetical protein A4X13_0g5107 [Tilletia indica]